MLRKFIALLLGESLLGIGLWMAWPPLAPIALGSQLVVGILLSSHGTERGDAA